METTVPISVMIQIYVVFPNTTDRQTGRSSILSSCCDVCHLYSLARKTWTVQIYVQRLQGMNVPINNSYSDNQRKRGCQLPDFHLVWNWRIHFATGGASPHLFPMLDFSSHLYPDETIPQFPKVGLMADRGPLVPVCIFSPSSSHEGETSQDFATDLSCGASCKLMMADTSVDKCRPPKSCPGPVNPANFVDNSALAIPWGWKHPVVQ